MVRMVGPPEPPPRPPEPPCHSPTLAIQLTQKTVTPANKNLVTRTNFLAFDGIFHPICIGKRLVGLCAVRGVGRRWRVAEWRPVRMRSGRAAIADCCGSADSVSTMRPSRLIVLNAGGRGNLVFYTSFYV